MCANFEGSQLNSLRRYKKNPLKILILIQKSIEFYPPHYEITQPAPCYYICNGSNVDSKELFRLATLLNYPT